MQAVAPDWPEKTAASVAESPAPWQRAMAEAITDPRELLQLLALPASLLDGARRGHSLFRLKAPRGYVARMRVGDADDPLLRQVLLLDAETRAAPGFTADAVGDLAGAAGDGVIHKYAGRALLIATGACAVHCRYCFRRHFPYAEQNAGRGRWRDALARLRADRSLTEVILSGGDPLSLSDRRLAALAAGLETIPQLRRLRIHTRLPIVLPERVDAALLGWLTPGRLQRIVVVHTNHPNEIDAKTATALRRLRAADATVLNQSVLLKGVNDDPQVLADLSERLFAAGVLPYYLHMLDRVTGAAHFEVAPQRARAIWQALAARVPGYLLPRLAREHAGEPGKTIIGMEAGQAPVS